MAARLSYITLAAQDAERLGRFYAEVFGLAPVSTSSFSYLEINGIRLTIMEQSALEKFSGIEMSGPAPKMILSVNVEQSEELDAMLGRAVAAGGCIVKPVSAAPWGGRMALFSDPENNIWELVWRD
jgi:hypothetical protein